jgi:putative spermidine/putrescine transport system permease protein
MGPVVRSALGIVIALVVVPLLIVIIVSVSGDERLIFPPESYSLNPYRALLGNDAIRGALSRSLIVGVQVVLLSLFVGVPATIALVRYEFRFRFSLAMYLILGVATPLIASAFAFLVLFTKAGVLGSLWPISVGITVVNLPFLMFSVASSLASLDPRLEEAAATLGAEQVQTFLFVTLPGIMPGILSGTIMVFVLGISEFVISLLLSTVSIQTLPIAMFASLRGPPPPEVAAAAGLYVVAALAVVLTLTSLKSTEQFFYRAD